MLLALLAACNQVYGLTATQLPPPDAPVTCPPLGTAPMFAPLESVLDRVREADGLTFESDGD